MRAMKIRLVIWTVVLGGVAVFLYATGIPVGYLLTQARTQYVCGMAGYCTYVKDSAGVLPEHDVPRFEHYMQHIEQESGIDVRFMFVDDTGGRSLEEMAVDVVKDLRIGGRTGEQRGLLLLYDVRQKRLKIEVGYGLEGVFPDVFVNYLVNRHARMFFESRDLSVGLRLLLRLLHHRIREAVLGDQFDPRVMSFIDGGRHLSGGAGVSASMADGTWRAEPDLLPEAERARYAAGESPLGTYFAYLTWLAQPVRDAKVDFFTPGSRQYVGQLALSPAYAEFILLMEYGKRFALIERGDVALLYFTSTPFMSPHFFVKDQGKWRIDILAEVQNTREIVGTYYTWAYTGKTDRYSRAFADTLLPWGSMARFRNGDNRPLPTSGTKR